MISVHVAVVLKQLADMMELKGENPFKVNAYRRAARAVENSRTPLDSLKGPEELPGIGKGTAAVIREIMTTGRSEQLEKIKSQLPSGLPELLTIPGLGPKSIHVLYRELGITGVDELQQAVEAGRVRHLSGFGEKKERNLAEGIRQRNKRPQRILLVQALPLAERLQERIEKIPHVKRVEPAGSLRRRKETVKDLDFVVATEQPRQVAEAITAIPEVTKVVNHGETKVSILIEMELVIPVDIRLVRPQQFVSALHHFTGSKEHNVRIRQRAKELGWKVSEYGIHEPATDRDFTFQDEQEMFVKLGLPYMEPEIREDRGEMDVPAERLPRLLQRNEYRGDLHLHTRWSDGIATVEEMAVAAKKRGYSYIAITDHSQFLKVAGGLTADDLKRQREEIDRVNEKIAGITVLAGVEMDILPDGRLDYPDDVLQELDVVIASIHSGFQQEKARLTRRIIGAMENPYVHIIAHPTGRLINRREPYALDLDEVFQTAKETGTILELNANPFRLDLNEQYLKRGKEEFGLTFSINTDAHSPETLSHIGMGLAIARRGWLEADDVINTYSLEQLQERLAQKWGG
ncbi:DNA polymerase/3'-5' exonuclease PolX [Desmospora activa]|uniref:DNA-directed DNA polymerase n=1 Tax=Desmospora activa DSM 45169 TaxID=1121389 RepID=A0A2T4Z8H0_9BACL|nr:DNA polymerase/3'-5' exonuclease PolX [Desmospora activa]PTM58155.1 DNA polymerase (family 10) [Desmospora activa DSM 45169]